MLIALGTLLCKIELQLIFYYWHKVMDVKSFEGMCCMNLSDHSESIHKSIQLLKEGVRKLQVDDGWNWLNNLLNG